jgi:hypothetical protein
LPKGLISDNAIVKAPPGYVYSGAAAFGTVRRCSGLQPDGEADE